MARSTAAGAPVALCSSWASGSVSRSSMWSTRAAGSPMWCKKPRSVVRNLRA